MSLVREENLATALGSLSSRRFRRFACRWSRGFAPCGARGLAPLSSIGLALFLRGSRRRIADRRTGDVGGRLVVFGDRARTGTAPEARERRLVVARRVDDLRRLVVVEE